MADTGNIPNHSGHPVLSEVNSPLPKEGEVAPPSHKEHKKDKEARRE